MDTAHYISYLKKGINLSNLEKSSRLENFPIMFYAVVMGLSGLGMAYERLNFTFDLSNLAFLLIKYFVSFVFVLISVIYTLKFIKYPSAVKKEFSHPIKINFFSAFSISLLLLSILWKDSDLIYEILFYFGLIIQTFLTLYVISFWINNNLSISHSNPAWFIPIVGNLIVVIASKNSEPFLWYYFSVGLFFWIVLFTIIFYRIIFHDQLAQKFMPTLFIMIAPPAIAFLGYIKLTKNLDMPAFMFLNLTLFFVLLLAFMYKNFIRMKFFISWWAFTFPMAAATIAFLKAYELTNSEFFRYIGVFSFIVLILFILIVAYFTIKNITNKEICIQE